MDLFDFDDDTIRTVCHKNIKLFDKNVMAYRFASM